MPRAPSMVNRWLWFVGLNLLVVACGIAIVITQHGDWLSFITMGFGLSGAFHCWLIYDLTKRAEQMRADANEVIEMGDRVIEMHREALKNVLEERGGDLLATLDQTQAGRRLH